MFPSDHIVCNSPRATQILNEESWLRNDMCGIYNLFGTCNTRSPFVGFSCRSAGLFPYTHISILHDNILCVINTLDRKIIFIENILYVCDEAHYHLTDPFSERKLMTFKLFKSNVPKRLGS